MKTFCVSLLKSTELRRIELSYTLILVVQAFQRLDIDESGEIDRDDIKQLMGEQLTEDELNEILQNKPTITKKDFITRMGLRRIERTRSQLSAFSRTSE